MNNKKICLILFILVISFINFNRVCAIIVDTIPYVIGDVNEDNTIDLDDVRLMAMYIINESSVANLINNFNVNAADYNGDGFIRINDITTVLSKKVNITLDKINIYVNSSELLSPVVTGINANNVTLSYSSSNTKIATVDDTGKVSTKGTPGTVTITVTASDGATASTEVNVTGERIHFIAGTSENSDNGGSSGDAILIESKGNYAMIDTGVDSAWNQINNYLKNQNVKTIEFILLTHMHSDHVGNFNKIINRKENDNYLYTVKNVYMKKYCKDGNEDSNYLNIYDCSSYNLDINSSCVLQSALDSDATDLEKSARYEKRIKCFVDYYNTRNPSTPINLIYVNDKNVNFNDISFDTLNFKMSLYQTDLYKNLLTDSENKNSIISSFKTQDNRVALLTGDAYDTNALNTNVATIRNEIGTNTIDVLKVPHHASRACAMLKKNEISTTLLNDVSNYVITNSAVRLNLVHEKYPDSCSCIDLFSQTVADNIYYTDDCTYDSATNTYSTAAVIADFTNAKTVMNKVGTISGCKPVAINKKANCS